MNNKRTEEQKELIYKLREISGAGLMDCAKALKDNDWNVDKAIKALREREPHILYKVSNE